MKKVFLIYIFLLPIFSHSHPLIRAAKTLRAGLQSVRISKSDSDDITSKDIFITFPTSALGGISFYISTLAYTTTHELGHAVTYTLLFNRMINEIYINLGPLGMGSYTSAYYQPGYKWALMCAAGPMVGATSAGITLYIISKYLTKYSNIMHHKSEYTAYDVFKVSLALGALVGACVSIPQNLVNFFPFEGSDGYQILHELRSK